VAELLCSRNCCPAERTGERLFAARHPDRGRAVAQVAAKLAVDGRRCVRRKWDAAVGVVPARRRHEAERADLNEVLERLAGTGVAAGKAPGERQVLLNQLPPYVRIQHSIQHHV